MSLDVSLSALHQMAERGQLAPAQSALARRLAKPGFDLDAAMLMSVVCTQMGEPAKGEYWSRRCIAAAPEEPGAHANLVSALLSQSQFDRAIEAATAAQRRLPESSIVAALTSMALHRADRRWEAFSALQQSVEKFPGEVRLYRLAVSTALAVGRSDLGIEWARRGVALAPEDSRIAADLIRALAYATDASEELAGAHRAYQGSLIRSAGPSSASWNVDPDPERRIRLGVVSGDLRDHAVMMFGAPLFDHYDQSRFSINCYSTTVSEDDVSAHIRSKVSLWRKLPMRDHAALHRQMMDDGIDVLLDLSGHTPGEMLGTIHYKPAPLCVHWIAFPGSLGMSALDYRITDSVCDPRDERTIGPERPLRIDPCYVTFRPNRNAPDAAPRPFARGGFVTFGSISSMMKLTPATISLWAGAVAAVPDSKLYYKSMWMDDPVLREVTRKRLIEGGIPDERIILDGSSKGAAATMACYAHLDISLDTFPYHGMTTTCESVWMGVPIVTLRGRSVAARVSCSLLSAMGLNELIAETPGQFVEIAANLARDHDRLADWRSASPNGLRSIMARSPLRDEAGFVRRFESAIRECWRGWCARQNASSNP